MQVQPPLFVKKHWPLLTWLA